MANAPHADQIDVSNRYDAGNLAQTYSALLCLAILGDDFSRVNRDAVLDTVKKSQRNDGCFWGQGDGSECDMRFVFCAVAICHMLNDEEAIDWEQLQCFIKRSQNYDGGIGQGPNEESHGGSSYCAIASLSLAGRLWDESVFNRRDIDRLIRWALWKQEKGFHGRAHKPDDSCYAFWIGATLEILHSHPLADHEALRSFLLTAQHGFVGGFCKIPEEGAHPDILHTYFSIAALSLLREPGFRPINAPLNVSKRAYEHIQKMLLQVPLVSADLPQDEAMYRVSESVEQFLQTADIIFSRLDSRIASFEQRMGLVRTRAEKVKKKVDSLKECKKAVVLKVPSHFPCEEFVSEKATFTQAKGLVKTLDKVVCYKGFANVDVHKPIDMRRELDQRRQFFAPSQLTPKEQRTRGRQVPVGLTNIADLYYLDTDRIAYDGLLSSEDRKKSRGTAKSLAPSKKGGNGNEIRCEGAAIGGKGMRAEDPLEYRPEAAPIEMLNLPDILPLLPGVAMDVVFVDSSIKALLPDIDMPTDESMPQISVNSSELIAPMKLSSDSPLVPHAGPTPSPSPVPPPPLPPPFVTPFADLGATHATSTSTSISPTTLPEPNQISSPVPPAPPPPPSSVMSSPPPPPPPPPPALLLSPIPSAPSTPGRTDLMAAIRAAGGSKNAKLKETTKQSNSKKKEAVLSASSALSNGKGKTPTGGDLMSSLSQALDARRKAISGRGRNSNLLGTGELDSSSDVKGNTDIDPTRSQDDWD